MKQNFLIAAIITLGSLFVNVANTAAQAPPVTPVDTARFHNGVESYIGAAVPGADAAPQFLNIGFVAPAGMSFGPNSYSLKDGSFFYVIDPSFNIPRDTLRVTVSFQPNWVTPFGDYVDTLTISTIEAGTTPFVLPLRGKNAPFAVSPLNISFLGKVAVGDTSQVAIPLTITTVERNLEDFTYYFTEGANSAFFVEQTEEASPAINTLTWNIWFAPPLELHGPTAYYDTLVVSHKTFPDLIYRIPTQGIAIPILADPSPVFFGKVDVNTIKTLSVTIKTGEAIDAFSIESDSLDYFSVQAGEPWDPEEGGELLVTFAPESTGSFAALLVVAGEAGDTLRVILEGKGWDLPVISSDTDSYDFGEVSVGERVVSDPILVVLTNPVSHLTDPGAFFFADPDDIFRLETLQLAPYTNIDSVYITISFTPVNAIEYPNTLIVQAEEAENFKIELFGTGTNGPLPPVPPTPAASPQQATAISGPETAAPALSVKDGDIIVSRAPAGSSIQVYNLQGKALKTQTVSSGTEILNTASFPRSVYIVLVNDRKEVILRQKVIL